MLQRQQLSNSTKNCFTLPCQSSCVEEPRAMNGLEPSTNGAELDPFVRFIP